MHMQHQVQEQLYASEVAMLVAKVDFERSLTVSSVPFFLAGMYMLAYGSGTQTLLLCIGLGSILAQMAAMEMYAKWGAVKKAKQAFCFWRAQAAALGQS